MTAKMPAWLVLTDGGLRCLRCGKSEPMPVPMLATAFTPWCQYQGAQHARCPDTGRVDPVATSVQEWTKGHDTGTSSKAIFRHMMGTPRDPERLFGDHPLDHSDFGRCYRLLALAPEWRARIGEMSEHSPEWAALAGAWEELTLMYEAVLGSGRSAAPTLHERMRALLEDASNPACPGEDCARCSGEFCEQCGSGPSACDHDVVERHSQSPRTSERHA